MPVWCLSAASARRGPHEWKRRDRAGLTGRFAASSYLSRGLQRSTVSLNSSASKFFIGCTSLGAIWSCKARQTTETSRGTFSLRSPARPNPIGTSIAKLVSIEGATVTVRGLDCLDGTPLLDLKPDRALFTPIAPPQPGDFQVGDP